MNFSTSAQHINALRKVDSFDVDSADEPGIIGNKPSSKSRIDIIDLVSQKNLSSGPVLSFDNTHKNNNMNGLFKKRNLLSVILWDSHISSFIIICC